MTLRLPDVTLIMVTSATKELSRLSIADTLSHIRPYETHIWSDEVFYTGQFVYTFPIPKMASVKDWNRHIWYTVPQRVQTSHFLIIQWDSWVINPDAWDPKFLSYDYIGATWPWHPTHRVGNGGFSLRSTKLMKAAVEDLDPRILEISSQEDDILCRNLRFRLEPRGLSWANEATANSFSREHNWKGDFQSGPHGVQPSLPLPFGFHDCRNWPRVLDKTSLAARIELGIKDPYIAGKSEFKALLRSLPR